jgi:MoxR-like ATPase
MTTSTALGARNNGKSKTDIVLGFVYEIHKRTAQLARSDESDESEDADPMDIDIDSMIHNQHYDNKKPVTSSSSPDVYVEKITSNLLLSCHPPVLAMGISNLPNLNPFSLDEATRKRYNNDTDNDGDDDVNGMVSDYYRRMNPHDRSSQHRPYQHRRTDYLRRLLRVMAPMTLEVAANVCSTVLSTCRRRSNTDVSSLSSSLSVADQQLVASIILFAHWLPVAPQLVPMVTEFFRSIPTLPWSSVDSTTSHSNKKTPPSEEDFVVAEALHTLCYFFYSRNEMSTLSRLPWDWTFVFGMLHRRSGSDDNNNDNHNNNDTVMKETRISIPLTSKGRKEFPFALPSAIEWYSLRILSMLLNWNPHTIATVVEKWQLEAERDDITDGGDQRHRLVPSWQMHPWEVSQEELEMEQFHFKQRVTIWRVSDATATTTTTIANSNGRTVPNDDADVDFPSADDVQDTFLPSPYLTRVGRGVSFYQEGSLGRIGLNNTTRRSRRINDDTDNKKDMDLGSNEVGSTVSHRPTTQTKTLNLVPTATTVRNLSLLGAALCEDPHPPPILVCGPHGSGKSSIIRELCRICRPHDSLMEFHIDHETDSKTLIGSYSTTDIPGEFAWRPGALTHACREGRWILLEDVDNIPIEIQAGLVKLLEERMLHLGNGIYERAHPNFRIFATCTTIAVTSSSLHHQKRSLRIGNHRGGGKQILNPSYWRNIHVKPLPYSELRDVAMSMFGSLPESVIDSSLMLMKYVDRSGRTGTSLGADTSEGLGEDQLDMGLMDIDPLLNRPHQSSKMMWFGGRLPSVRDIFKLLSRISNGMSFEKNVMYLTESQRTSCMAESVETFLGSCSDQKIRKDFVCTLAAPTWGIDRGVAIDYIEKRKPTVFSSPSVFQIGRAKIEFAKSIGFTNGSYSTFAETNQALRLMESIAVCVRENEPVLLVGETGCGKTTVIQQLATYCERKLVVQNLSLQTDSTDLLGGYRPLEIRNVARHVYEEFVDTFVANFSRKQNLKFLEFASSMLARSDWKKLSQCFQRAAQLGAKKMRDRQEKGDTSASEGAIESCWKKFARNADRFERQRTTCDAGLAFEFAEGALVDALRTGKW